MPAPCLPFIIHVAFNPASVVVKAATMAAVATLPRCVTTDGGERRRRRVLVQLQKVESYILVLCQALLMCFGSSFLIECRPTACPTARPLLTGWWLVCWLHGSIAWFGRPGVSTTTRTVKNC